MATRQRENMGPASAIASRPAIYLALVAMVFGPSIGCYDGEALVTQARSAALTTRLAEVDLGAYHTSLPRDPKTGSLMELGVHVFGTVPHYRVAAIERQLRIDEYQLRHEILVAVRSATREELGEPHLTGLRARIERIVNGILDEAPVKAIGFYEVTIRGS